MAAMATLSFSPAPLLVHQPATRREVGRLQDLRPPTPRGSASHGRSGALLSGAAAAAAAAACVARRRGGRSAAATRLRVRGGQTSDQARSLREAADLDHDVEELLAEVARLEAEQVEWRQDCKKELFTMHAAQDSPGLDVRQLQEVLEEMLETKVSHRHAKEVMVLCRCGVPGRLSLDEFLREDMRGLYASVVKGHEDAAFRLAHLQQVAKDKIRREKEAEDRARLVASLPPPNDDAGPLTRLLATLPYAVVFLDGLRIFGPAFAAAHDASLLGVCSDINAMVPDVIPARLMFFVQPLIILCMPALAVQRKLPAMVRFNLNQAFVLDLMLALLQIASWCVRQANGWEAKVMAKAHRYGGGVLTTPQKDLPSMPGNELILAALFAVTAYCVASTLLGQTPDAIPGISREASRSLGTQGRVRTITEMKREEMEQLEKRRREELEKRFGPQRQREPQSQRD